ncbi:cardiolipin synthase [Temperatibacter marinus]|uniref:Cardiolipin synthase n=1 Tax=Temperatibacter marinus TaxID=1456591 RepID=A0AA52EIC7_9PROT|nr:cardiolipin synthase [Temperatibacter marinus]WND03064.1 cardiolipin synthase [Temperatibacter marinus]
MIAGLIEIIDWIMVLAFALSLPILASIHILRSREDVGSAIAWMSFVWFVPVLGVVLYMLLGINRIRRRARAVRQRQGLSPKEIIGDDPKKKGLVDAWEDAPRRWRAHARLSARLSRNSLTAGNSVEVIPGGKQALDAMLLAINEAEHSVALTSYIFQVDQAGRRFVSALVKAQERGVAIRVLVDAVGNWYGFRPVLGLLRRHKIPVASFNPPSLTWRLAFFNLRTHRKILVVDGQKGFAGGVNIHRHYLPKKNGLPLVKDTHFSFQGPIVDQMMDVFSDDWSFVTGEELEGRPWYREQQKQQKEGHILRGFSDGPDEERPVTLNILESALYAARQSVRIVTPYFIPDVSLIHALQQAALRGVDVQILVPKKSNIPLFSLATSSGFSRLLRADVKVYQSEPTFDHSKLLVIDDHYGLVGSSNWDARSLRLNFEFNMELYGSQAIKGLSEHIHHKFSEATLLRSEEHEKRPLWNRVTGRLLWLLSPYL